MGRPDDGQERHGTTDITVCSPGRVHRGEAAICHASVGARLGTTEKAIPTEIKATWQDPCRSMSPLEEGGHISSTDKSYIAPAIMGGSSRSIWGRGGGYLVWPQQPNLPPKSSYSLDFGHFILKIPKNRNEKVLIFLKKNDILNSTFLHNGYSLW